VRPRFPGAAGLCDDVICVSAIAGIGRGLAQGARGARGSPQRHVLLSDDSLRTVAIMFAALNALDGSVTERNTPHAATRRLYIIRKWIHGSR
jgi:hypothetical protein